METRLVKQIFYVMLSMYTNNPINLAINAPSGEGKSYIIKKVGELFPKNDVIYLAGLSENALFHRNGILVVKNPLTGEYENLENLLEEIDDKIRDKDSEASASDNSDLKRALREQIKDLEKEKKGLTKDAKKLIDLSHTTLVLIDTPSKGLFAAIMSLLSHDHWEVEYEFADTSNSGINTKVNVLRGWPCVIFAQAVDYSSYSRWSEVQRRFIITNPNMDPVKYDAALDLMAEKFGSPNLVYEVKIVSREEKEVARDMIKEIKGALLDLTVTSAEPGDNNVIVPFIVPLNKSLSRQKASDMTIGYRLFSFLSLVAQINLRSRCCLRVADPSRKVVSIRRFPLATFEDLKEALYLMEFADGVRPYILEWYHKVFLPTYNAKEKPDTKSNSKGELVENRLAVTIEQLANATKEIQQKIMSKQQIRENYVGALMNNGYIDKIDSEIDRRSDIYYPLILKIENLDGITNPSNLSQGIQVDVSDPTIFPSKTYLTSYILSIIELTVAKGYDVKILSPDKNEISVEGLVNDYYSAPQSYFHLKSETKVTDIHQSESNSQSVDLQNSKKYSESQQTAQNFIESIQDQLVNSNKLDGITNSFNYSIKEDDTFKKIEQSSEDMSASTNSGAMCTCQKCGEVLEPFYMRIHHCEGLR